VARGFASQVEQSLPAVQEGSRSRSSLAIWWQQRVSAESEIEGAATLTTCVCVDTGVAIEVGACHVVLSCWGHGQVSTAQQ
jgi:hypothetical protein